MASEREPFLRELFERWNRGEREFDAAVLHPQGKLRSQMTGMSYRADELGLFFAEIDQQFSRWQIVAEEFVDVEDDLVLALGHVELTGRASGLELSQPVAYVIRFDGGLIRELTAFPDHDEGRRAAGLG
jgi:ketosteroid isomerase-like protein